jgi:hypothetical protein
MGKMQRNKGANFERAVANALAIVYPQAKRGIGQARSASEVADVDGTPWWVECKVGARPNLLGAMRQARKATDGRPCLVVAKVDRQEPVVVLGLAEFLRLADSRAVAGPRIDASGVAARVPADTYAGRPTEALKELGGFDIEEDEQ